MERKSLRIAVSAALAAAVLIVMMACMQAESFAGTYEFQNPFGEGVSTTVTWPADASSDSVSYAQLTTSKKGRITFSADFTCDVALCNSNGDVVSWGSDYYDDVIPNAAYACWKTITFGVSKGKTYYLRITGIPTSKDSSGKYVGTVKWTGTKYIPGKAGKKKSRAASIKRKKTVKGLIVAGDRKAKWYKIKTSRRSVKIYFNAKTDYQIKAIAYYKKGGKTKSLKAVWKRNSNGTTGFSFINPKGTIYIKVIRVGKGSGSYTLKWK